MVLAPEADVPGRIYGVRGVAYNRRIHMCILHITHYTLHHRAHKHYTPYHILCQA